MIDGQVTLKSRYEKLAEIRAPFLKRARKNAIVTIPSLFPPEGADGGTDLYDSFQSLGAYGVNNLSSKLMISLFAPHRPFYRLLPEAQVEEKMSDEDRELVDSALAKAEARILEEINSLRIRPAAYRTFRHLIVGGNILLSLRKGKAVSYTLDQYVVVRAYNGELLEAILREVVPRDQLPETVTNEDTIPVPEESVSTERGVEAEDEAELFTHYYLDNKTWRSYQEVGGKMVEGSEESYGRNKPAPILALRWYSQDGEDYGRSFCDDYYGDLATMEGLSKNLRLFAGQASKVTPLVDPAGTTDIEDLEASETGQYKYGNAEDITYSSLEAKAFDFSAASAHLETIRERLRFAFLLNTAVQRNAERVTAEEIRFMMNELETAHGGVLSNLSDEYQLPLVQLVIRDMVKRRLLPELKKVKVTIVTGIDALSRSQELQDLAEANSIAAQLVGPEELAIAMDSTELLRRIFVSKGVKTEGLLRSAEEQQQIRQQQQAAVLAEKAAGPVAGAIAGQQGESA